MQAVTLDTLTNRHIREYSGQGVAITKAGAGGAGAGLAIGPVHATSLVMAHTDMPMPEEAASGNGQMACQ